MRVFRSSPEVYDEISRQMDAVYGYPRPGLKTERALPVVWLLPVDNQGLVYLACSEAECEYDFPSEILPTLLASGAVVEVTPAEFLALLPQVGPV